MRPELLHIPERQRSNVPELLEFFRDLPEASPIDRTMRFLRSFAGTVFEMPGSDFFRDLERDEQVVQALQVDQSAETRVSLLLKHKIDYSRMQNIYRVCIDKNLDAPPCPRGRLQAIEEAARWIRMYKSRTEDLVAMYSLSAPERTKAIEAARRPPVEIPVAPKPQPPPPKETVPMPKVAPPENLTAAQISLLKALKEAGGEATPRELARLMKTICPTKTIRSLMKLKLVLQPGGSVKAIKAYTKVKLTEKGRAA